VSVNAPLAFDASVKQLVQLLAGHALVVIPEEVRRDGAALLEHIREQRVDVLDVTPPQLRLLLAAGLGGAEEPEAARPGVVLVGGEQIDHALWKALAQDAGRAYYNVYGPTECTVDSSFCLVAGETPSIGRPVANATLYVLDPYGEPAPLGIVPDDQERLAAVLREAIASSDIVVVSAGSSVGTSATVPRGSSARNSRPARVKAATRASRSMARSAPSMPGRSRSSGASRATRP